MLRTGRRRPLAWIVALLAMALMAGFLLLGGHEVRRSTPESDQGDAATARKAPQLLPAAARPRPSDAPAAKRDDTERPAEQDDAARGGEGKAAPPRKVTIRVVDAAGQPIVRARIAARLEPSKTGQHTWRNWFTNRDGHAQIELPEGRIIALQIDAPARRGARRLLSLSDPTGLDLSTIGEVQAEDLFMLAVRTVDPSGLPRPGQRVLYRPRKEDEPATGWSGLTSDAEGWCRVGPYAAGTRVEVRPGPRGLTAAEIAELAGWQVVYVDGTAIEILVGYAPKLRLAFPNVPLLAPLRIAVLDADTGEPLFPPRRHKVAAAPWTAPALTEDHRLEVVVYESARGRYARLHDVVPAHEPLAVDLQRGVPLTGRVIAPTLRADMSGRVRAVGRGFEATARVLPSGRFRFVGLPDESFTLTATVRGPEDGTVKLEGSTVRLRERHLDIPVRKPVRITGRIVVEDADASGGDFFFSSVARSSDWPKDVRVRHGIDMEFSVEVPPGRWRLEMRVMPMSGTAWRKGELDLGNVQSDLVDVVVHVR